MAESPNPEAAGNADLSAVRQLLGVLRNGVSEATLRAAPDLMTELAQIGAVNDTTDFKSAIRMITQVGHLAGGQRGRALRMMMRLDPETRLDSASRTDIAHRMGQVLDRRKNAPGLGLRRIEQIERTVLAPYVAGKLGLIDEIQLELFPDTADSTAKPRQLPVFVQYCNPELFRVLGRERVLSNRHHMLELLKVATRMALLLTDNLILFPFSYIYEVPAFQDFLTEAGAIKERGLLGFVSPTADLEESRQAKAPEYGLDEDNPYSRKLTISPGLAWRPRASQTTALDIASDWADSIDSEQGPIFDLGMRIARRLDRPRGLVLDQLRAVPERLEGSAFIGRFAVRHFDGEMSPQEVRAMDLFLSDGYVKSYLGHLDATVLVDFPFRNGALRTPIASSPAFQQRVISVSTLYVGLERMGIDRFLLQQCTWEELLTIRANPLMALIVDSIAFRSGDPLTERAIGELSRFSHPSGKVDSFEGLHRVFELVGASLL